jgi:hypothetical protein
VRVCVSVTHLSPTIEQKVLILRTSVTELIFFSSVYNLDLLVATKKPNEGSSEVKEAKATTL